MIILREWAMPCAWTFKIKPIKRLLNKYVKDPENWIDPFAGDNSPVKHFTNDINPNRKSKYHMDALEFCQIILHGVDNKHCFFSGVIFDPPYSYRQISEHYKERGKKPTRLDTSSNFYNRVMNAIYNKIIPGGYAISFGWNSNGFGKKRGFEIIEVLLVAHGGHHNDTIVVVERKMNHTLNFIGRKNNELQKQ